MGNGKKLMKVLDQYKLAEKFKEAFKKINLNDESISYLIEGMIQTSLRGVDSHGINMFPYYHRAIAGGRFNTNPDLKYKQTSTSTGTLDADHASGHHAGSIAMKKCIEMAKTNGIGAVSVCNSTHFGAAAYFGLRAADNDYLGFATTMGTALVNPFASKELFFGTNPLCFTAPLKDESPLCVDMATSLSAWNRVDNYRKTGKKIPDTWALDKDAKPTTDPSKVESLVPIGGYKGTCVAIMLEVLCAILGGKVLSKDASIMHLAPMSEKRFLSHFFMAINVEKFTEINSFKTHLQNMVNRMRDLVPIDSEVPVQVPGDPEKKKYEVRIKDGIPIDDENFNEFLNINKNFNEALK